MLLRSGMSSSNDDCLKQKTKYEESGKCLKYVSAPIDKFGVGGRWFRHKLLDGILVGTPVLLTIQNHRTPKLSFVMKLLSFLGTEDFYTVLFLALSWTIDIRLARLFGILMTLGFYTTGFLKTFLCLPRPPCPPVVPLEKAFDWALPSHHSLLGVIMPWYIWMYVTVHYNTSTFGLSLLCTIIVLWSFGVLLSRLYLGVHSPADIVCGGIVGVLVLCMWIQVDDYVDFYISQQQIEPQLKLAVCFFFLLCIHPVTEKGNPSFNDTCILAGVASGIILARSQRSRLLGMSSVLEVQPDIAYLQLFILALLRLILGGIIINVTRVTLRVVMRTFVHNFYRLCGFNTFSSKEFRKNMKPNPKHYTKYFKLPPIHESTSKSDDEDSSETTPASSFSSTNQSEGQDEMTSSKDDVIFEGDTRMWWNFMQIWNVLVSLAHRSPEPWDVDLPSNVIVYTFITYSAVELLPQLFALIGI